MVGLCIFSSKLLQSELNGVCILSSKLLQSDLVGLCILSSKLLQSGRLAFAFSLHCSFKEIQHKPTYQIVVVEERIHRPTNQLAVILKREYTS